MLEHLLIPGEEGGVGRGLDLSLGLIFESGVLQEIPKAQHSRYTKA